MKFIILSIFVSSCLCCSFYGCDGSFIDLSKLTLPNSQAYVATSDDATFYFNICAPTAVGGCETSASCQFLSQTNVAYSCGTVASQEITSCKDSSSVKCQDDDIVVSYNDGMYCYSTNKPRSTQVILRCSPEATEPLIVSATEVSPCMYEIIMETVTVCPTSVIPCSYTFSNGSSVNLSGMRLPAGLNYVYEEFFINVCGPATHVGCENGAVCQTIPSNNINCGTINSQIISAKANSDIVLSYTEGTICANYGSRNTSIVVSCDYSTSGLVSSVQETSPCNYQVNMKSLFACAH